MTTKHQADEKRGRFEELAERRSEAAIQQKLGAISAALLEQRNGNETAAQDELAGAIGVHDET